LKQIMGGGVCQFGKLFSSPSSYDFESMKTIFLLLCVWDVCVCV
jgi:hypothetical protein